ncbi:hypothetical protein M422DRAFT_37148, partial [Sphaerobolus stellatus SS14]
MQHNPRREDRDPHYTHPLAALEVINLGSVQEVVERIWNRKRWVILDRSGELARAQYVVGGGDGEDNIDF